MRTQEVRQPQLSLARWWEGGGAKDRKRKVNSLASLWFDQQQQQQKILMAPDCFCWTSVPGVVVILLISYMEELAVIPVSLHKTNKRGCNVFT